MAAGAGVVELDARSLERLIEGLPNGVVVSRLDGVVVAMNAAAEHMFRRSRADLVGRSVEELIPVPLRAAHRAHRARYLGDPAHRLMGASADLPALRGDGSEFPAQIGLGWIQTADGPLVLVSVVDQSERRRAEDLLQASEERLGIALAGARMGVWEWTIARDEIYWSPGCYSIFGLDGFGGSRAHFIERIHPDDASRVTAAFEKAISSRTPFADEYRIVMPDGAVRWIANTAECKYAADGTPLRVVGTVRDVTDERRAGDALRDSQATLRSLYENSSFLMGVAELDGDQIVGLHGNPAAARVFGVRPARSPRRRVDDLTERLSRLWVEQFQRSLLERAPARFEFEIPTDAGFRWLAATAQHLGEGPEGRPRFSFVAEDVTPRRVAEETLRRSERDFRQLADSLPHQLWTADARGRLEFVNQRLADYVGLPGSSVDDLIRMVHPDDREAVAARWEECLRAGSEFQLEGRLLRHDGVYRWFDSRARPLRDASGSVARWFGSNTDVHDAHLMRNAMREEEERLGRISAAAPGVIFAFRRPPSGALFSIPDASPRIEELLGSSAAALRASAEPVFERIHPDDVSRVQRSLEASAASLALWECDFRYRHPEGREIWIAARATPEREPDGGTLWYGFLQDATQRKRAEQDLRTSQTQLVAALEAGGMSPWIWEVAPDRMESDERMRAVFGLDPDGHVGIADVLARMDREDRPAVRAALDALLREGDRASAEFRVVGADGQVSWFVFWARLERDAAGRPHRAVGVNMDITERKRTEAAVLRAQKLEALGTLAGGIAHDFNNILLAIVGNAEIASAELAPDHPASESVAQIERASARAADLVRQILAFSRPHDATHAEVQLEAVVTEALRLVRATTPAMIEIQRSGREDLPPIRADATQIHQVIVNLATNAAHAIGSRPGRIDVRLDDVIVTARDPDVRPNLREGRYVRVSISDDGAGMDATTLARIFDPFFTTKAPGEGTGLGLSVVHGIVASHGGSIAVDSQPGTGSRFTLCFPALARAGAAAESAPVRAAARGRGGRVLFVDDETAVVSVAKRVLESCGYAVAGFSEPGAALEAFRGRPHDYDIVVTDVSMPGMTGFQLVDALLAIRADVPIVMTSGYVPAEDLALARDAGASEMLQKPYTTRDLVSLLDRLLASGA